MRMLQKWIPGRLEGLSKVGHQLSDSSSRRGSSVGAPMGGHDKSRFVKLSEGFVGGSTRDLTNRADSGISDMVGGWWRPHEVVCCRWGLGEMQCCMIGDMGP